MTRAIRGEVWFATLGEPTGHEQAGMRPVIVLQDDGLSALSTTIVVPLTSNPKAPAGTHVLIAAGTANLPKQSVALCHQVRVLDMTKLTSRLGALPPEVLSEIEGVVAFVLGLPTS